MGENLSNNSLIQVTFFSLFELLNYSYFYLNKNVLETIFQRKFSWRFYNVNTNEKLFKHEIRQRILIGVLVFFYK